MSAGFGWSISDVVILIKITSTVLQSLKQDGGASSEFQKATRSLESLQAVLGEVRRILQNAEPSFRDAIHSQVDESTSSIAAINQKLLSKYGDALGAAASKKVSHGVWKKLGWTFHAAADLGKFQAELSQQLETVKLLMITQLWSTASSLESTTAANRDLIVSSTTSAQSSASSLDISIRNTELALQKSLGDILELSHEGRDNFNGRLERLELSQAHIAQKQADILRRINSIGDNLRSLKEQRLQGNACTNQVNLEQQTKLLFSVDDIQRSLMAMGEYFQERSGILPRVSSNKYESVIAQWTLRPLMAVRGFMAQLIFLAPQLLRVLRILSLAVSRRLPPGDTIRFYDHLGMARKLNFAYFRHYEVTTLGYWIFSTNSDFSFCQVFQAFIMNDYEGKPGAIKISRRQFHLLDARNPRSSITKANWKKVVQPGIPLVMLIYMVADSLERRKCIGCERMLGTTGFDGVMYCKSCNRAYRIRGNHFRLEEHYFLADHRPKQHSDLQTGPSRVDLVKTVDFEESSSHNNDRSFDGDDLDALSRELFQTWKSNTHLQAMELADHFEVLEVSNGKSTTSSERLLVVDVYRNCRSCYCVKLENACGRELLKPFEFFIYSGIVSTWAHQKTLEMIPEQSNERFCWYLIDLSKTKTYCIANDAEVKRIGRIAEGSFLKLLTGRLNAQRRHHETAKPLLLHNWLDYGPSLGQSKPAKTNGPAPIVNSPKKVDDDLVAPPEYIRKSEKDRNSNPFLQKLGKNYVIGNRMSEPEARQARINLISNYMIANRMSEPANHVNRHESYVPMQNRNRQNFNPISVKSRVLSDPDGHLKITPLNPDPATNWTEISKTLINAAALHEGNEDFISAGDCIYVWDLTSEQKIREYIKRTKEITAPIRREHQRMLEQQCEGAIEAFQDKEIQQELASILKWGNVLSGPERNVSIYSLMQQLTQSQISFFLHILQEETRSNHK